MSFCRSILSRLLVPSSLSGRDGAKGGIIWSFKQGGGAGAGAVAQHGLGLLPGHAECICLGGVLEPEYCTGQGFSRVVLRATALVGETITGAQHGPGLLSEHSND